MNIYNVVRSLAAIILPIARKLAILIGAVFWIGTTTSISIADSNDLSYPGTNSSIQVIDPGRGESNQGTVLTAEEIKQRQALYRDGHWLIDGDLQPVPPHSVKETKPTPQAAATATMDVAEPTPDEPRQQPSSQTSQSAVTGKQLFWEIKGFDARSHYLLGTIHIDDPRVLDLPPRIRAAFDASSTLAVEAKMEATDIIGLNMNMVAMDGSTLDATIGPELFADISKKLSSRGIPERVLNTMKPWAVMAILSSPENSSGQFLDRYLYTLAKASKKQIVGLESLKDQLNFFDKMPVDQQVSLLRNAAEQFDQLPDTIEAFTTAWLEGDLDRLVAMNEQLQTEDSDVSDELNQRLVVDRNHNMVTNILPLLSDGSTFIAVGALHLPGDDGIVQLLRDQGFEINAREY